MERKKTNRVVERGMERDTEKREEGTRNSLQVI